MYHRTMDYPIVCPKCGSWEIDPCFHRHKWKLLYDLGKGKLHVCRSCGWKGYVARSKPLSSLLLAMAVVVAAILLVALAVK